MDVGSDTSVVSAALWSGATLHKHDFLDKADAWECAVYRMLRSVE